MKEIGDTPKAEITPFMHDQTTNITASEPPVYSSTMALSTAFCACTMVANIMSVRMIAPFGIIMDAGALLYPATFLIRDWLHRNAGLSVANRTVTVSVLCNIGMFALFWIASIMPPDMQTGPQSEFAQVLLPGVLIVLGSAVAQFVSERIDGTVYQRIYKDNPENHIKAALCSNSISIPIDSIIMCGIAFGFTIPFESVVGTTISNIVIKFAIMLISLLVAHIIESKIIK